MPRADYRSRSSRNRSRTNVARVTSALRVAPRHALERCLLECYKTHGLPQAAKDLLLMEPAALPESTISVDLQGHSVQLPPVQFGRLLTQGDKGRLQGVSRTWCNIARTPALWGELSLRHAQVGATSLLALLSSRPMLSQIRALALPKTKLGPRTLGKIQALCPNILALDTTAAGCGNRSAIADVGSVFGTLRHLRIDEYNFSAVHFDQVLQQCRSLQSLEAKGPLELILTLQDFPRGLSASPTLEELSLDLDFWNGFIKKQGYETSTSTRIMAQTIVAKMPNIRKVCLSRWTHLTEEDVGHITSSCPHLVELRLAGLRNLGASHRLVTRTEDWRVSDFMSACFPAPLTARHRQQQPDAQD
jgi:hypothetical protein